MTLSAEALLMDATSAPSRDALSEVSELAARQIELEDAIEATEAQLASLKRELAAVRDDSLPNALAEHGLSEIAMKDGSRVKVVDIVRASIPAAHRDAAFRWLEDSGFGDLIKHEIKATFGRGEEAEAQASIDALRGMGIDAEDKRTVHPQTLGAFVREQIEQGSPIPRDVFGVFIGRSTKISRAK